MKRHEDGAHEVTDGEARQCPTAGQGEHRHRESPGDYGQQHEVRPEPYGEHVAGGSVARVQGNRLNGAVFQPAGFGFVHVRIMLEVVRLWNAAASTTRGRSPGCRRLPRTGTRSLDVAARISNFDVRQT